MISAHSLPLRVCSRCVRLRCATVFVSLLIGSVLSSCGADCDALRDDWTAAIAAVVVAENPELQLTREERTSISIAIHRLEGLTGDALRQAVAQDVAQSERKAERDLQAKIRAADRAAVAYREACGRD